MTENRMEMYDREKPMEVSMAGSLSVLPNGKWYVNWYDKKLRKTWKIYRYKGYPLYNREMAEKLLHAMQNDIENGCFRIEKYTRGETDVIPYLREWLEATSPNVAPSTYNIRRNAIEGHLVPWFVSHQISLHEIQYDNLVQLMNSLNLAGVSKLNVLKVLHACLKFAKRSLRIQVMPEFPERDLYRIVDRPIRWLSSEDQAKVISAIPLEHQPIFWWLKYHLRRPGEAMALRKEDYDGTSFTVQRGFSAKRIVERSKTGKTYLVPVVSAWVLFLEIEIEKQKKCGVLSPFFFVSPNSRTTGKHYTSQALNALWRGACQAVGVSIDMYSGLKHSTASQMRNERGYSLSDIQTAMQSSYGTVQKYAATETGLIKALLEGNVIEMRKKEEDKSGR